MEMSFLIRKAREPALSPPPCEGTRRGWAIDKPGSEPLPDTNLPQPWSWISQPPGPWEIKVCYLNHPIYSAPVVASWPRYLYGEGRNVGFGPWLTPKFLYYVDIYTTKQLFSDKEQVLIVNMNTH